MNTPTPHPQVNQLLQTLLARIQAILGPQFVGMYLFGSLANGGFDQFSDIDFIVVTQDDLPGEQVAQLREMHEQVAQEAAGSHWARQVECSYIPKAALRRYDPANANHPHLDRGNNQQLQWMQHNRSWVVQRHTLREHGLVLSGPALPTLIDPTDPADLRLAMHEELQGWATEILQNPPLLA